MGAHLGSTLTTATTFLCVALKLRRSRPLLLIVVLPCACRLLALCGPASTAPTAGCLSATDCCGKCWVTASFATPKWNSCGKQRCRAKFATRERLEQLGTDNQLLFIVANVGLQLYLPHKSRFRVANRDAEPDLPHGKGWNSWGLTISCYLLWQMLDYGFICHTKVDFGWQTEMKSRICHTGKVGTAGD